MVGGIRYMGENVISKSIIELVDGCSNLNHLICLSNILHREIHMNRVNKSAQKGVSQCEALVSHANIVVSKYCCKVLPESISSTECIAFILFSVS